MLKTGHAQGHSELLGVVPRVHNPGDGHILETEEVLVGGVQRERIRRHAPPRDVHHLLRARHVPSSMLLNRLIGGGAAAHAETGDPAIVERVTEAERGADIPQVLRRRDSRIG